MSFHKRHGCNGCFFNLVKCLLKNHELNCHSWNSRYCALHFTFQWGPMCNRDRIPILARGFHCDFMFFSCRLVFKYHHFSTTPNCQTSVTWFTQDVTWPEKLISFRGPKDTCQGSVIICLMQPSNTWRCRFLQFWSLVHFFSRLCGWWNSYQIQLAHVAFAKIDTSYPES